jgi:hypothetical protein
MQLGLGGALEVCRKERRRRVSGIWRRTDLYDEMGWIGDGEERGPPLSSTVRESELQQREAERPFPSSGNGAVPLLLISL